MKDKLEEFVATGRRKTAVASVRLRPGGTGKILINGRAFEKFFPLQFQRNVILAPINDFNLGDKFDMVARVKGGGTEAQAIAMRLGIARALVIDDEERRPDLKSSGYLKRDPRKKERKKYGLAGARKRFQFSKR
ncbi:MAG: small subunit ribosomal protein S9 [Chlamydiales bacterium]|jgi:small subunit ribosomal protein S9